MTRARIRPSCRERGRAQRDPGGTSLNCRARQPKNQALLRARFRVAFFLAILGLSALLGNTVALAVGFLGVACGLCSLAVARRRGCYLAHTFVVVDWLVFACVVALAGATESWLLITVPFLTAGHLGLSRHAEWPYLLAPTALLVIVLGIADPNFGGHKLVSVGMIVALVSGGVVAAQRLALGRQRRQQRRRFDPASGLYTAESFRDIASVRLSVAAARGHSLAVVHVRLEGLAAIGRLHSCSREALIRRTAEHLKAQLRDGDLAFRLSAAEFAVLLPGSSLAEASRLASKAAQISVDGIAAGRRLELLAGAAAFPEQPSLEQLLNAARESARASSVMTERVAPSAELAAAQ